MPELLRASLDRVLLASEGGDPRGVREIPKVLLWSTSPPATWDTIILRMGQSTSADGTRLRRADNTVLDWARRR